MKILSAQQIREADQFTIEQEPITSIDLMERASMAFVSAFRKYYATQFGVVIFAGTGNNGGDGLAVGRILDEANYKVKVYHLPKGNSASKDFTINLDRLGSAIEISSISDFPVIAKDTVIIDALFGSGLNRPLQGLARELVQYINQSGEEVVSIDIASGLNFENFAEDDAIVKPNRTISFELPKLPFFQPSLAAYVGDWETVPIGLDQNFINKQSTLYQYTVAYDFEGLTLKRPRFMHKGGAGRAQLCVGSRGKMGAGVLAAKACLRAGVGLLHLKVPNCGEPIVQTAVPEAMVELGHGIEVLQDLQPMKNADVIGIGPGIGTNPDTAKAMESLLTDIQDPMVLDADALNIISEEPSLLNLIPAESVLTPHPGEFRRLVGSWNDDYQKLRLLQKFCRKYSLNVVLKGAFSAVCNSSGEISFNSTGNPGMATAGSGDVLFGIVCGFMAQGILPEKSLRLAVFLHGLAGDLAAVEVGELSLTATDIVDYLPRAIISISA